MDQFTFNVAKAAKDSDTQEPVAVDPVDDVSEAGDTQEPVDPVDYFSEAGVQIDNTMEHEQLHDDM